jgi:hypothetical protein
VPRFPYNGPRWLIGYCIWHFSGLGHIYIYIYIFSGCGLFRIVSKHFKIGPSKLILFGMFKWVGLIGLIY